MTEQTLVDERPAAKDDAAGVKVICVGNEYRHDDGVALLVASLLEKRRHGGLEIVRESGDGAALLEAWNGAKRVILVDAAATGAEPGTVYRLQMPCPSLLYNLFPYSTHAFGVAEAIDMGRALDMLPDSLIIYAIEGEDFEDGNGVSPLVEQAAYGVVDAVLACTKQHASPQTIGANTTAESPSTDTNKSQAEGVTGHA